MHILHEQIGAPHIKIESESKNSAILSLGPLPSGYGLTIGNALRRVLLSSLPGTAVTAVKIDGVAHEYSTVVGLKESVFDITLNLRQLKLKKHTKGVELVELPLIKSGKLMAKNLKVSSDIEILDPAQLITTCDGADNKKKIILRVEKGVGYQLVSNLDNAAEENPEFMLIDANFSPVTKVKYDVSPARVADQTSLDQLQVEIETTGAIDAKDAIKLASGILQNYFELFNKDDAYTDEEFTTSFEQIKAQKASEEAAAAAVAETAFTPIDILGLSQRTLNALVNGDITSIEQLVATPMTQLSQLRGFGQKAKTELEQVLSERGYSLQASKQPTEK